MRARDNVVCERPPPLCAHTRYNCNIILTRDVRPTAKRRDDLSKNKIYTRPHLSLLIHRLKICTQSYKNIWKNNAFFTVFQKQKGDV